MAQRIKLNECKLLGMSGTVAKVGKPRTEKSIAPLVSLDDSKLLAMSGTVAKVGKDD